MNKIDLTEKISKGESISESKELFDFVNESAENAEEYIRQKNVWAILQTGNQMDTAGIESGYRKVQHRVKKNVWRNPFFKVFKYAAIIFLALAGGYLLNRAEPETVIAMNEISVPPGNRTSVTLPDGSVVWISNGSKLIYPENFTGNTRNVQLEGEGFFEVTHDKEHPFIVSVGKEKIKVLGTKFAVMAYPEDNQVKAELISGKIQFDIFTGDVGNEYKSFLVKPSHSLVYDKTSGKVYESIIPDGFYDYWLEGTYRFKNESFASLSKKIERIYNVEIIFEDARFKTRTFTGTLHIDDNIYTIMEAFKSASGKPFKYKYDKGKIFIKN
ncbi:MAG: FecR family protein [Draconibacterium sp.]